MCGVVKGCLSVYGVSATLQLKDPLELFMKRREFHPSSRFLSRRDMTQVVGSEVNTHSFLPYLVICKDYQGYCASVVGQAFLWRMINGRQLDPSELVVYVMTLGVSPLCIVTPLVPHTYHSFLGVYQSFAWCWPKHIKF